MIPTSAEYQAAVVSGVRRSTATILFGVYDVTARDDADVTANGSQPFTSPNAVNGDIREQDYKVATFEDDFFRLDGSFYLMPDDINPAQDIIGWYSLAMSDANREFAVPPTLTINFDDYHSSRGLGVFFGSAEYCTDFDVTWYDGNAVLGYVLVSGNANQEYNIDKPIENYNKIVIRFLKTRKPYRYARLMEIGFGLEAIFDSDKLVDAVIVEEVDPVSSVLSINTLKFTVLNEDQEFNMLNPQGIFSYLQRRQKLVVRSGIETSEDTYEYVPMGTYYLSDWKNSNGLTATLDATDAIGLMDKTTYRASPYWVNEPVENVIRHILNDAGDFSLTVTPEAAVETVTGYIPVKSHREALADVLIATRNNLRVERSGILTVSKVQYTAPVASIDYETMIGSPEIVQKPLITAVEAKEFNFVLAAAATELVNNTFNLVGQQTVHVEYGGRAAANASVTVTGAGNIVGVPVYSAVGVTLTINGTGQLTVTVTGKEYIESSNMVGADIGVLPAGEVPQTANVNDNKLITVGKGQAVAQWVLDYFQRRIGQNFEYWSNPAIQAGDFVSVETMFGQTYSGVVERQEITIAPRLIGRVEVTG